MPLYACNGCVKNLFVTEEELIDRFTGQELLNWGANCHGNLGDNNLVSKSVPVQTISGGTNWRMIDAGKIGVGGPPVSSTTAGIKTDGSLWLWGSNNNGSIGDNTLLNRSSPVQTVSSGTNWKRVSLNSAGVTAAIKTDGTLWLWGCNSVGNLGNNNITSRSSPVQTISVGTNWKCVDVSIVHVSAIKTDGTLWLWGYGGNGRLGNNTNDPTTARISSPVQTTSGGTNWKSISNGFQHSFAIKTDGTLWAWGRNNYGQLGLGNNIDRSTPLQMTSGATIWKSVSAGSIHSTGIKQDGSLWVWGQGASGRLGGNNVISRSSPVQTVSGGTDWRLVQGANFNTRAIKTDGTLWSWGAGNSGLNGDNSNINRSSPVQTVSGGTNWRTTTGASYSGGATRLTEF
jgi:alpha-tubulin suppressor-like RCC1 family protein